MTSYSHAITQTVNWSDPGDRTAGRSQHADFVFAKLLDKASPKLALYCWNGRVIPSVTLELCRDDRRRPAFHAVQAHRRACDRRGR